MLIACYQLPPLKLKLKPKFVLQCIGIDFAHDIKRVVIGIKFVWFLLSPSL